MAKRKKNNAPTIGDNSGRFAKDQLKAFVERIERLEAEKAETAADIRDVYAEAKGTGFDVRALRTIIRLRKQDTDERREQEMILETYMMALGMLSDTPLGRECRIFFPHCQSTGPWHSRCLARPLWHLGYLSHWPQRQG